MVNGSPPSGHYHFHAFSSDRISRRNLPSILCHRFILESMIIIWEVLVQCLEAIFLECPSALFLTFAAAAWQAWCYPTHQTLLIGHHAVFPFHWMKGLMCSRQHRFSESWCLGCSCCAVFFNETVNCEKYLHAGGTSFSTPPVICAL
jgi:hypothetical protein